MSGGADIRVAVFLAGVQKAGTTSLFGHLAEHPGLSVADAKELHFFDDEAIDWARPDYEALHRRYAPAGAGRLRVDATPIYLFWPPAMARIRRYNPAAKFIVLVREPIARAFSSWCMESWRGVEPLPFPEAIRGGRGRLRRLRPTGPEWREFSYVERGLYGEQAARALALFPREQFLFVESARLQHDHTAVLRAIASFLDVPPFPGWPPRREHQRLPGWAALSPQPDDCAYLARLYHHDTRRFAALSGLDLSGWPSLDPARAALGNGAGRGCVSSG